MEYSKNKSEEIQLAGFASVILRGINKDNGEQVKNVEVFIENYTSRKEAIKKYRNRYPDNGDFFEACYGRKPKGNIEVVSGEVSLHLRCYDVEDYLIAYSFGRVRGEIDKLDSERKGWYSKTASAATSKAAIEELHDCITIENVQRNPVFLQPPREETPEERNMREREYSERARIHEEQHLLNRLFVPQEAGEHLRILNGLRDEVLALYRGGRNNADTIYKNLTEPGGVYASYFRQSFGTEVSEENYGEQLKNWLSALTVLEEKGYSSDEVLALLYWHPITTWPQVSAPA